MSHVLVYSRHKESALSGPVQTLCEKLSEVGHHTEQTHSTHLARLLLNNYECVHLFIAQLPLNVNEIFFLSFAKTLGKSTVLSVFNSEPRATKPILSLFCPDALTLSQTNHLQYYRQWACSKSVMPLLPHLKNLPRAEFRPPAERPFLIPIEKNWDEIFLYKTLSETYFDGRHLLLLHTATQLRKKWQQAQQDQTIPGHCHLILSDEKIDQLLKEQSLQIVLANPTLKHTEFTAWLEKSLNQDHLLILNEFQATGFSHTWTSGQNCLVIHPGHWPKSFNLHSANDTAPSAVSRVKFSKLSEPLVNELSRLYTKILRQKTSLISTDSVKM